MVDTISEHTVVVNGWHGTPKLFAHLVRVVHEVTGGDLLVDVAVGADHERFGSAEDFLDHLSPEALRTFSSIAIHADGPAGSVRLTFEWLRSWWKPGLSPDTQIVLQVTGPPDSHQKIETALRRGVPTDFMRAGGNVGLSVGIVMSAGLIAVFSLTLLLNLDDGWLWTLFGFASVLGIVVGAVVGTWLFPEVEIAEQGHRSYVQVLRFVVPLLAALVIAGLSKSLFG